MASKNLSLLEHIRLLKTDNRFNKDAIIETIDTLKKYCHVQSDIYFGVIYRDDEFFQKRSTRRFIKKDILKSADTIRKLQEILKTNFINQ